MKEGNGNIDVKEGERKLLEMSEISLWLDNYDDIFSDFDPRPYSQRALSEDFLGEAKRASRDKVGGAIELKLLLAEKHRDKNTEKTIKKRLKEHFKRHHDLLEKEKAGTIKKGLIFGAVGVIMMFIATYILVNYGQTNVLESFIIILLEPAGWYFLWSGLDLITLKSKAITPDLDFYEKMVDSSTEFVSY